MLNPTAYSIMLGFCHSVKLLQSPVNHIISQLSLPLLHLFIISFLHFLLIDVVPFIIVIVLFGLHWFRDWLLLLFEGVRRWFCWSLGLGSIIRHELYKKVILEFFVSIVVLVVVQRGLDFPHFPSHLLFLQIVVDHNQRFLWDIFIRIYDSHFLLGFRQILLKGLLAVNSVSILVEFSELHPFDLVVIVVLGHDFLQHGDLLLGHLVGLALECVILQFLHNLFLFLFVLPLFLAFSFLHFSHVLFHVFLLFEHFDVFLVEDEVGSASDLL